MVMSLCKSVVTNTDAWNLKKLIPSEISKKWNSKTLNPNKCDSFLHIHLGFDADGLENLPIHAIHVDEWEKGITAERNIAVFSIPSALDKNMASAGKHVLHGHTLSNESWEICGCILMKNMFSFSCHTFI